MRSEFDRIDPSDEELADASAALDGEGPLLDGPSPEAVRFVEEAMRLRRLARLGSAPPMPDLTEAVLAEFARDDEQSDPVVRRWPQLAAVAAAFVIGLAVSAAFLLDRDLRSESLAAAEIEMQLRAALADLSSLDATVVVTERGVHPDVPERRYEGLLQYRAPEQLRLSLIETTEGPLGWPANDLEIVVNESVAWRSRRLACPVDSLPECLGHPAVDGVESRSPFSAGWAAPLGLVVPVDSVRQAPVVSTANGTITAVTTVARARALIETTIENGGFRQVHADDELEIRLDAQTLLLRGFSVRAAGSEARVLWATTWGYDDPVGTEVIRFDLTPSARVLFDPQRPSEHFSDGGFRDRSVAVTDFEPRVPESFGLYRSGVLEVVGAVDTEIAAWTDGRAWVTVRSAPSASMSTPVGAEVRVVDGQPVVVDLVGHEALVLTASTRIVVAGTLPLDELVAIAAALPVTGVVPEFGGAASFSTVDVDGVPVRVEVTAGRWLPPPERGDIVSVALRGTLGRHSPTLGSLTWLENGMIVVVSAEADLDTLLVAANELTVP